MRMDKMASTGKSSCPLYAGPHIWDEVSLALSMTTEKLGGGGSVHALPFFAVRQQSTLAMPMPCAIGTSPRSEPLVQCQRNYTSATTAAPLPLQWAPQRHLHQANAQPLVPIGSYQVLLSAI
mmetsp:Transcript_9853/g.28604  ORF Transcript_9853/g.28604 Transcript_9853/m.28604 type:complete len:122 (-) Transcript_9853:1624-1989(-)